MNNNTTCSDEQEKEFKKSEYLAEELERKFTELQQKSLSIPLPLQRECSPAKPYPFEALGSIVGGAAQRLHEVIQAPDATCGQSVLAALSLACQGFIDIEIDGRKHPASLFMLTISESGERKSATDKVALKPITEWQKMLVQHHRTQLVEYKNKFDVWKYRRSAAIKDASEIANGNLASLEPEPKLPCEGLMLCEEPTLEGLEQLLEKGQPSAGIFSDEGGRIIGGHAMNAENALKTACGLSNLWDGKPLTRVRKSEGSKIFYGRRLAVHLMIQPIVLTQLLNNEMLMGQGLLSRCLFSAPVPIAGTRKYREVDLSKDSAILLYYDLVNKILDRPFPKKNSEQTTPFESGDSLDPIVATLQNDAKSRWIEFHDHTDSKMGTDGELYPIKSFASKAAEQVLRIAAIFAYSECLDRDGKIEVNLQQLNRSITLVEYYLTEALRIIGKGNGDPLIYLTVLTLDWIKRNRSSQLFPLADVYQRGPNQIRTAKIAKKVMKVLEEHGYVIEAKNEIIDGRKVKSAWSLIGS